MDISRTIKALDQHMQQTIDVTSRQGHIQRGSQPNFAQLMMQLVANQVTIMQSMKSLLMVMNEDTTPSGMVPDIPNNPFSGIAKEYCPSCGHLKTLHNNPHGCTEDCGTTMCSCSERW